MRRMRFLFFLMLLGGLTPCHAQHMAGKTIVLTTPESYAPRLERAIEATGAKAIKFPTIETVIPDSLQAADSLLHQVQQFDWIVLPSRNAIRSFFYKATQQNVPKASLANLQYCTIGKDSELLKNRYGFQPAIKPGEPSPRGIVQALGNKAQAGQKVLVVAPEVHIITEPPVIPNFIRDLQALNLQVTRLNGYMTQPTGKAAYKKIIQKLYSGTYDMLAFTSTGEIEALQHLIDTSRLPQNLPLACFGPVTAQNADSLGFHISLTGRDYSSFTGFAEAMEDYFHKHP